MLTNNPFVRLPLGLYYLWASTALPDYYPLTSTSLWLEWRLWGMNPTGYHLTNILLHAVSAVLMWRVLAAARIPGAWLAALVFAVHPVNVQSVAWIAERKNTLCMVFFLLSLLWYGRQVASTPAGQSPRAGFLRNTKWYWLSLGAFLCALLSKTAVVMLPVILVLFHWWQSNPATPVQRGNASSARRGIAFPSAVRQALFGGLSLRLLPFFALSLVLGLVTVWFQAHRAIGDDLIRDAGFLTRLSEAGRAVWFYWGKLLFPVNLSFVYPQWKPASGVFAAWLPLAGLALVLGVFWVYRRSWGRHALLAAGWFVLLLLPVLGFVDIYFHRYAPVADHWSYFAGIGMIALIVGTGTHVFLRFRNHAIVWLLPVAAAGAVGWMGVATWRQTGIYRDLVTLWEDTLAKNPACWMAHNGLGGLYAGAGQGERARAHFAAALALKPDALETLNNFASVLLDEGSPREAIGHLRRALEVNPRSAMACYNLGNAYDQLGEAVEAEKQYRRALELDPGHAEAHSNLGCLLYAAGRKAEAVDQFNAAISLRPAYAEALNNLGVIFLEQGRFQQAESLFSEAARHKPGDPDAWFNLGNALLAQGRARDATTAYRHCLAVQPRHALARCRLGTALWHTQDATAALEELNIALKLQPDLAEAHHQMGITRAAEGQSDAALAHFRRAVELQPDWPEALASLAFTLATVAETSGRNGAEALRLAGQAVQSTGRTNFITLDALAAAQAETGAFGAAAQTAAAAVKLARTAGDTNLAARIESRQKHYESGKPYRQ